MVEERSSRRRQRKERTGECRRRKRERASPEKRMRAVFVGNDGGGKKWTVRSRNNSGFSLSHSCVFCFSMASEVQNLVITCLYSCTFPEIEASSLCV